ncbi:MAG: TM0106 family RecB-like putative nuclease [Syntrophales bacterium]
MQKIKDTIYYSASDIVNFLECEHLTALDLINLETPLPQAEDDEEAVLYQKKGIAHEGAYVDHLRNSVPCLVDVSGDRDDLDVAVATTKDAMRAGADIIYQAALWEGCFIGHADFLRRVATPSHLGNFSYEVIDTKLARSAKASYLIQLCFYSELVANIQGREPLMMHIVLGDRREVSYRHANYSRYYGFLKQRFLARVHSAASETYPDPCGHCDYCRWRNLCEDRRLRDDHLSQVANITRLQIRKLNEHGVATLEALARFPENEHVPKMAPETSEKLRHQAALQLRKRETGKDCFDLLPLDLDEKRGFLRLPEPDAGDIFFDMEGNPLAEDGLEYLFGVLTFKGKKPSFQSYWAHDRHEERQAFEQFMDFVAGHLRKHPHAHIYHYAHYEETALKRLMSFHGTREAEVDNLLRFGKLIDLFKVVRESMRISEPRYSIKNVEHFYLEKRDGQVKNAGASIVYYERWKEMGDPDLLKAIQDYNRDDLKSTQKLRQWLLTLRPDELPWANCEPHASVTPTQEISDLNEIEQRLAHYRESLVDPLPEDRDTWASQHHFQELTWQLLDFHRRAEKPGWWAYFSRREMTDEELMEDLESIGGMTRIPCRSDKSGRGASRHTYLYPEQETKLKTGDNCIRIDTLEKIQDLEIDENEHCVTFLSSARNSPLPEKLSIGPGGPISTKTLREALYRFADDIIGEQHGYKAIEALLRQEFPRIKGRSPGDAVIMDAADPLPLITEAVANLDQSCLFIQGPPGAGKTWTGADVIVELLRRGFRIGISSNSHKAINNLLASIERVAGKKGVTFRGAKKSTADRADSLFNGKMIEDVFKNRDLYDDRWQLVAGTAWLFSADALDQTFDYLFVDEAGQVAIANLVAMATSSKNIVLLGDQMQLAQPIQGIHPGRSGESSLEYLLNGMATIPPERGIFLKTTWRMHPDVCRFISDAVYDSRLDAETANSAQRLILGKDAHPLLKSTGIRFVTADHDACSQRSAEEAEIVSGLYRNLLKQRYKDKKGKTHRITEDNILVVAPYNMQVNLLRQTLPEGARVGTVDKFQGQEAEVVIISMATSSGDYLPRFIEFLYSRNRLNVAISRARCLAILVANPALMSIRCTTPEQMALVNTLCWVKDYSDSA